MQMQGSDWLQLRDLGVNYAVQQQHHAACFCLTEALAKAAQVKSPANWIGNAWPLQANASAFTRNVRSNHFDHTKHSE